MTAGLGIYFVHPRYAGSLRNWSGLEAPDGKSPLIRRALEMGFNTIEFPPLTETTHIGFNNKAGHFCTDSLYAIRDHNVFSPEINVTPVEGRRETWTQETRDKIDAENDQHFKYFTAQAREKGLRVMGDLVLNQVAGDHPLVMQENEEITHAMRESKALGKHPNLIYKKIDNEGAPEYRVIGMTHALRGPGGRETEKTTYFKFCRNDQLELLNFHMATGYDTARINYQSPEAMNFFVNGKDGKSGYWMQHVDHMMDLGFTDFRGDLAFRVYPEIWSKVGAHALARNPDAAFAFETLPGADDKSGFRKVMRLNQARVEDPHTGKMRPVATVAMSHHPWWNLLDKFLVQAEPYINRDISTHGSLGAPDNHDVPTLAGGVRGIFNGLSRTGSPISLPTDEAVARVCIRNYALAALMCNSSMIQAGYELCNEKETGVFKGQITPQDREHLEAERGQGGHILDIRESIRAVNDLKKSLGVENCHVEFGDFNILQDQRLVKLECKYIDVDTGQKKAELVLLFNRQPEYGPVELTDRATAQHLGHLEPVGGRPDIGTSRTVVSDIMIFQTPAQAAIVVPMQKKNVPTQDIRAII